MVSSAKSYWFCPNAATYLQQSGDVFLLYKTTSGEHMFFRSAGFSGFVRALFDPKNHGVVLIDPYLKQDYGPIIREIVKRGLGRLVEVVPSKPKPVAYFSQLNNADNNLFVTTIPRNDLLQYLHEVSFFVNDRCMCRCAGCQLHGLQTSTCLGCNTMAVLRPQHIAGALAELKDNPNRHINISGGNLLLYPHWDELMSVLGQYSFNYHLWVNYLNMPFDQPFNKSRLWATKEVSVIFPIKREVLVKVLLKCAGDRRVIYHFHYSNEAHLNQALDIISLYQLKKYVLYPYYNGHNRAFVDRYIYLRKKDLFKEVSSERSILRNRCLNANYFGKLLVLPNGEIKASFCAGKLGTVGRTSMKQVVEREFERNTAWRKMRTQEPCAHCVYRDLCPPIGGYECVLGQSNLCHVMSDRTVV